MNSRSDPEFRSGRLLGQLRRAADVRFLALALVLFTFIFRVRLPSVITDDAYITFRYAENIARGVGFLFNEGERVLGTTTPLFALTLAIFKLALQLPPTTTSLWIAAVADAATVYILYRLSVRVYGAPWPGILAGLLFALSPLAARFSINGMETSLAVALVLSGLLLYLEDKLRVAALICALAILARPEAGLLVFLITIDLIASRDKRQGIRFSGGVAALVAPWIVFALLYFGSPIPQSLTAKSTQVYLWSISQTVSVFLSHFAFLLVGPPLGRLVGVPWPGAVQMLGPVSIWVLAIALAAIQVILMLAGVRRMRLPSGSVWILVAFPAIYLALYLGSAFRNVKIFDWYLAPLQPFYFLFIAAGLGHLARGARSRTLARVGASLLVLSQISGLSGESGEVGLPLHATDAREREYREVAVRFEERFGPKVVVAAPEIGALGYFSESQILDTVGLVTPNALAYYPISESLYSSGYAVPPELIRDAQPDYVVTLELFVSEGLLRQVWFDHAYDEIYRQPSEAFGGTNLLVFERNLSSDPARTE